MSDPVEVLARFSASPKPHRSGEAVLDVVYADPGNNGFYYREKKPDSVAAFIRADLVAALVAEAVAVAAALASCSHEHETHINRAAFMDALGPEIAAAIRNRSKT